MISHNKNEKFIIYPSHHLPNHSWWRNKDSAYPQSALRSALINQTPFLPFTWMERCTRKQRSPSTHRHTVKQSSRVHQRFCHYSVQTPRSHNYNCPLNGPRFTHSCSYRIIQLKKSCQDAWHSWQPAIKAKIIRASRQKLANVTVM